jgi:MYXO-CTERM domain-containing protein
VSREGAPSKQPESKQPPPAGTPIWVWILYLAGILAGTIIAFSVLFTFGARVLSDDVPIEYDFSWPATIVWGGLALAAVVTFVVRRRQRR